jgi:hypothetical protein
MSYRELIYYKVSYIEWSWKGISPKTCLKQFQYLFLRLSMGVASSVLEPTDVFASIKNCKYLSIFAVFSSCLINLGPWSRVQSSIAEYKTGTYDFALNAAAITSITGLEAADAQSLVTCLRKSDAPMYV